MLDIENVIYTKKLLQSLSGKALSPHEHICPPAVETFWNWKV